MNFNISCYFDYRSYASMFRAMCVKIADYKLYFSFGHLIGFEEGENLYITKKKFNYAGKHKNFLKNCRYNYKSLYEVEQDVLEFMVFKDMLKIPFDDILRVMHINISSYGGYHSNASKYKAMRVELGKFKLYFSYQTLIVFETPKDQYITNRKYSLTTSSHKYSARIFYKNVNYVEPTVLDLITLTSLLKISFEEAKQIAGFPCERIHFA